MNYDDLLSAPFVYGGDDPAIGLDCWGMAREICRRAGRTLPAIERTTPEESDLSDVTSALVRVKLGMERVGDLFMSDPELRGYPSHVAVMVAPGWVLTTTKHGPRAMPMHRVACDRGVWRCP